MNLSPTDDGDITSARWDSPWIQTGRDFPGPYQHMRAKPDHDVLQFSTTSALTLCIVISSWFQKGQGQKIYYCHNKKHQQHTFQVLPVH